MPHRLFEGHAGSCALQLWPLQLCGSPAVFREEEEVPTGQAQWCTCLEPLMHRIEQWELERISRGR